MTKEQAEITERIAREVYKMEGTSVYEPVTVSGEEVYSVVMYPSNPIPPVQYDEYGNSCNMIPNYASDLTAALDTVTLMADKLKSISFDKKFSEGTWCCTVSTVNDDYAVYCNNSLATAICGALLKINPTL